MLRFWSKSPSNGIVSPCTPGSEMDADERDLYGALGRRAAQLRHQREMTQQQLAELVGVQPETVSRWETGQRGMSVATLARLADALDVSLGDLLDIERTLPEPSVDPLEQQLLMVWRTLGDRDQRSILAVARTLVQL